MFVQTLNTPNPNSLKFLPGEKVSLSGPIEFTNKSQTSNELIRNILSINGVTGIFLSEDFLSINKSQDENKTNFNVSVSKKIADKFPDSLDNEQSDNWIQIKPDNWLKIAHWLRSDNELHFDSLQCNTGMDLGEGILESRYNLHSMKHLHKIEVRIKVSNDNPNIPSVEKVWRVADWFERETYDMFGINFIGHRDLRRILLPEDWEGWPLRKDYQEQETYHGIVVPKVKEGWE